MPLVVEISVHFAWDTEIYAKSLLLPFPYILYRWTGLEPRLYHQNTVDKLSLLTNAKLLVSIFSGVQELLCKVSIRESSLVVI